MPEQLNSTTWRLDAPDALEVIVGDEKMQTAEPRIKVKKWDNESNLSMGWDESTAGMGVVEDSGELRFTKGNISAHIYTISEPTLKPITRIRRVLAGNELTASQATSEYELFNQVNESGTFHLAHYVVTEPSLALFDKLPASVHLTVDKDGYAKDYDYKDKSAYHPDDIPLSQGDVKVCRFYTPYVPVVNPYYMDGGIHNIDMQYNNGEITGVSSTLMDAIQLVLLDEYGIETTRHGMRAKLYFAHNGRTVKFFSAQEEGKGCYSYLNISSSYNKAYDFYRPDVEKDIRDQYAYGLQFAFPQIGHELIAEIMQKFASLIGVPLEDIPYTEQEQAKWSTIDTLHQTDEWTLYGKRRDANYFFMPPRHGAEMLFEFAAKPFTNLLRLSFSAPKSAVAYIQGEQGLSEYLKGSHRPDDIVNSIAIYNPSSVQSPSLGSKYETGKIGHIYRPFATDANGLSVWCDFVEVLGKDDGSKIDLTQGLTVEMPQWFLDEAVYPVRLDPIFGYDTAGASNVQIANIIVGTVQNGIHGDVTTLHMYAQIPGGDTSIAGGLYDEAAGGLIAESVESADSDGAMWYDLAVISQTEVYAGTNYILSMWSTTGLYGGAAIYYDSTSGKSSRDKAETYSAGNWPDPITWDNIVADRQYSMYATTVAPATSFPDSNVQIF